MRRVTLVALAGMVPFIVISLMLAGSTLSDLADPCRTWGDQWGPTQSGGGTSIPGQGGCSGRSEWTTESRGSAVLRAAWLPVGTLAALVLVIFGFERGRPVPTAVALALVLALGFPLTISATLVIAAVPALVIVGAARHAGLAPSPSMMGVGIATLAATLLLVGMAISSGTGGMHPIAWLVGATYPLELLIVAALCLWPRRAKSEDGTTNAGVRPS